MTFTCQPVYLLPYLYRRFDEAGGHIIRRKVSRLDELKDFDVVINCSGLGARHLANDALVVPVRGQVIRVKASWLFNVFMDDSEDGNYIIPKYVNPLHDILFSFSLSLPSPPYCHAKSPQLIFQTVLSNPPPAPTSFGQHGNGSAWRDPSEGRLQYQTMFVRCQIHP